MNGVITRVEIPSIIFIDPVPLFYRSVIVNICTTYGSMGGILSYSAYINTTTSVNISGMFAETDTSSSNGGNLPGVVSPVGSTVYADINILAIGRWK